MSSETPIDQAARFLFLEHEARRNFAPIPEAFRPASIDEAYDVQEAYARLVAPSLGAVAGYKLALTTAVMQERARLSEPVVGAIFERGVHASPARLAVSDYVHLGAECEIAFQIGADLGPDGAPFTRDEVGAHVSAAMAAFELVDDRYGGGSLAEHVLSAAADTAWNAGVVLGTPVEGWRNLDLAGARGELKVNGVVAGDGFGRDVMGHPLEALTWFVNMHVRRGRTLEGGAVVLTGSLVPARFLHPGDVVDFGVDALGAVRLEVT